MTNSKNLTLLCVEDDLEALEDIQYLLKRYFNQIYTATNGQEALDIYKSSHPDIILLDINIPKLNGIEVASKIRINDEITPIIFLTAHSQKEKLLQAINLQISSYIIKPFKIQELKDSIFKTIKKISIQDDKILLEDNFTWNHNSYELCYQDIAIAITKNEMLLIKLLLTNRSRLLTTHEIALELYTNNNDINGNNIAQLISRFKKKVEKQIANDSFFIENIYGGGYRIK